MAPHYKEPQTTITRDMEQFRVFMGTVMSVDPERFVCTVEDLRTRVTYKEVGILPTPYSTYESTDVFMPEIGATCLCVPLFYMGGYCQVAILTWTVSHTKQAVDSIARKDYDTIPGLNERKRGNLRKAHPGQHAMSSREGYSEKTDTGWDRTSLGQDKEDVDAHRRTWKTITSRHVRYSDAGLGFEGPVVRPGASTIPSPTVMPDGSREYTLFLQPNVPLSSRYMGGQQDVVPFSEKVTRVQEFSLDYPLPPEALQTSLIDYVLGTTSDPWGRTTVTAQGGFQVDSQTYFSDQDFDHPYSTTLPPVGPTLSEGPTPARKGFILERSEGTLVGFNLFDTDTYGKVLKPILSDLTGKTALNGGGRFGANFESGYNPVVDSTDHVEARLAASCHSVRFPNEYNTTRWDISKEGMLTFEIGSTMPKENIKFSGQVPGKIGAEEGYEHPHGAGRSVEGHLVGSLKMVIGKNRDEEDAIDLQALGQTVLRLGCDDASLPDAGRSVQTQIRGSKDLVQKRSLQYWTKPAAGPGDPGSLTNKTGMESVSVRMATDGSLVARIGARPDKSPALRRHLVNGYSDGPGRVFSASAQNSHSPGRPTYGSPGDSTYRFHDLTQSGSPRINFPPYNGWLGNPVTGGMDAHGLSIDLHAVRDALVRIGRNPSSGQSLLMDLDGGIVLAAGKDNQGRSLTGALDGGVELTIGKSNAQKGARLEIDGDVDLMIKGNYHIHCTGDVIFECTNFRQITKLDHIVTCVNHNLSTLATNIINSPIIGVNEGNTVDQTSEYL